MSDDPRIKRAKDAAEAALKAATQSLQQAKVAVGGPREAIAAEFHSWETDFAPIKQEYESLVKAAGGGQGALDQRRRKLVLDLAGVERQIAAAAAKIQLLRTDSVARQEILTRLDQAYTAYFNERSERCKFFTTQAHGSIDVSIAQGRDVSQFRDKLLGLKKGSYMREDEIEQMVQSVTPRELVGAALRYAYLGRVDKKPLNDLAQQKGAKPESVERIVEHILDSMPLEQLLALVYETTPQDVPEIRYEVGGVMKPLAELSVGQKASALLIVGLSDGRFPIVIDQPEDSLDLRSIWEDVCTSLRDSKDRRQFIFTTHNSSVAVASDSDKFTILQAGATQATVVHSGSINSADVKKEVIAYLEGGPDTYEKKRAKYNLEHRPTDND